MAGHWVFRLDGGGYVGPRKSNGRVYEYRPAEAATLNQARVFNTKAAASRAGSALRQRGKAVEITIAEQG